MAEFSIAKYSLLTNRDGTFTTGKIVHVVWESTIPVGIKVYLLAFLGDTSPTLVTSGPSLGFVGVDHNLQNFNYQFCADETAALSGPDLHYFVMQSGTFPYVRREVIEDSFVCSFIPVPVCDLVLGDTPLITPATSDVATDGAFTVSATSSNGTIKYGLTDFVYSSEGQLSGVFTGKLAGTYTVFAKDSSGCVDSVDITIPAVPTFGVKYVAEWNDVNGVPHKVEILERNYAGSSSEVLCSATPSMYRLNSDGEDRDQVIRASEFKLFIEAETESQYIDLYTEDSRFYQLKYYRDSGSGFELKWIGYINPFLYSESYTKAPNGIEVIATDGLANLKDLNFLNESGINFYSRGSALSFISQILKKCDLDLNILSGINLYENSMPQTDADDPLMYTEVNPTIYFDVSEVDEDGNFETEDCAYVIENILKEFKASICQANGKWVIYRPEETRDEFDYREFDSNGVYVSNGTIDPIVYLKGATETNRLVWQAQSGVLSMMPNYGKFIVRQVLNKKKSLLPSYGFEKHNIVQTGNPFQPFFDGWNISIQAGSEMTWGFEDVQREGSNGAFYVAFGTNGYYSAPFKEVMLYTSNNPIQFKDGDRIKISFDYLIDVLYTFPWVMLQYKLKVGSYYLVSDGTWNTSDLGFIDVYADKYNSFQTYETTVVSPGGITVTESTVEFSLKINNNGYANTDDAYDIDSVLKIPVLGVSTGTRRIAYAQSGGSYLPEGRYFYELESGDDAEDFPNIVHPSDWHVTTNPKVWVLKGKNDISQSAFGAKSILIDNTIVEYLPDGSPTPESQESIVTVNTNNKRTLVVEILQGDCPVNITNARFAYDSFFTYDGDPTETWKRDGLDEGDFIQRILLRGLISQYQKSARRLSGSLVSDIFMLPYSCLVETMDNDRLYQTQGLEIDLRLNTHTLDLYELKEVTASPGEGGNPSPFNGAFYPPAFNTNFD